MRCVKSVSEVRTGGGLTCLWRSLLASSSQATEGRKEARLWDWHGGRALKSCVGVKDGGSG